MDFEGLTLEELIEGFSYDDGNSRYICSSCGAAFDAGEIYKLGERFFEAAAAVRKHVETEHTDKFNELISTGSKYLALTDNQKELLLMIESGLTDNQIAAKLNVAQSTVRHQRFIFREKAKAAKMYLAIWSMATSGSEKNKATGGELLTVHEGAKMVDDRYVITEAENKKILSTVFESLEPLKLRVFSAKQKRKIVILRQIAQQFEKNRRYTEKEINATLQDIYEDYVTIRRYLIEYGYMDRTTDCREYWMI